MAVLRKGGAVWRLLGLGVVSLLAGLCTGVVDSQSKELPWSQTLAYLKLYYGEQTADLGVLTQLGSVYTFRLQDPGADLLQYPELLVVQGHGSHVPPVAVVKPTRLAEDLLYTLPVQTWDKVLAPGDRLQQPLLPRIYLTTNVPLSHVPKAYTQLLQALLTAGFEVVEVAEIQMAQTEPSYGLELHVDVGPRAVFCRIKSLFTRATWFVEQQEASFASDLDLQHQGARGVVPSPLPAVTWQFPGQGYELPEGEYSRFCLGDTDGDGQPELALLSNDRLMIYSMEQDGLRLLQSLHFGDPHLIPLHLHHLDLDGDGRDEFLITMTRTIGAGEKADHQLASMVVRPGSKGLFVLARDLPWYLRVIVDRTGRALVLGQSRLEHDQYDGPIVQLVYDEKKGGMKSLGPYGPAQEIYSLYQFNLEPHDPNRLLIVEPNNEVSGYHGPDETIHAYSLRSFGDFQEVAYPQRLAEPQSRGSFKRKFSKDVFAARRFLLVPERDQQCFLIDKGRLPVQHNGLPLLARSEGRNQDGVVGLTWQGTKIRETYQSTAVDRDIVDFGFVGRAGFILLRDAHKGYSLERLEQD